MSWQRNRIIAMRILSMLLLGATIVLLLQVTTSKRISNESPTNLNQGINALKKELNGISLECFNEGSSPMLIFYFSTRHCEVCVDICLKILNDYQVNDENPIISVVGFFDNVNMHSFFKREYPNLRIVESGKFPNCDISKFDPKYPYFLEIDEENNLIEVFIPDKNKIQETKEFLSECLGK